MSTDVLAVAEHRRGELRDVSYELLTVGRKLADGTGGDLHVAIVSGNTEAFADDLNREGIDYIHTISEGEGFNHDIYAQAAEVLHTKLGPEALVVPNSVNGLDYAPAVANRLDLPLATDAVALDYDTDGGLTVTRKMYGSKVEITVDVGGDQYAVTVRGGEWSPAEGVGDAEISAFDADIDTDAGSTATGFEEVGGDVDISEAEFIVSIGRGIEEEDNLPLIEDFVEATDATLASSRPSRDVSWGAVWNLLSPATSALSTPMRPSAFQRPHSD